MISGFVYLIGAGPGNPKLITVRGLECLRQADVVVYDRLGTAQLLQDVPAGAEVIYVGKAAGDHTLPQPAINQLLIDRAKAGRIVARLKGGDPFVFGRGGEEAEALAEHGIPFEVVPGITSAIAAPAYAGIPVTHRACASNFVIATGHEDPTKDHSALDWQQIARAGTAVFLMGLANLGGIARRLMECGRNADTPVALIRWGSRTDQQTVTGTLATIEQVATAAQLAPPVVIVVGEVVNLRAKLRWFESKPLFGRRIAVVRDWDRASSVANLVERLGGEAVDVPVMQGAEPAVWAEVERTVRQLRESRWAVFPTAAAVRAFFGATDRLGLDARCLAGARVIAAGEPALSALRARGIRPDYVGAPPVSEPFDSVLLAGTAAVAAWHDLFGTGSLGPASPDVASGGRVFCLGEETAREASLLGFTSRTLQSADELVDAWVEQGGDGVEGSVGTVAQTC